MKKITKKIKKASETFRKYAKKSASGWLTDNFYILEGSACEALKECRKIRKTADGPEIFPGLFDTCLEICGGGILPPESELVERLMLRCRDSSECSLLPLAITCALIIKGEEGVKNNSSLLAEIIKSLRKLSEMDFEAVGERLNQSEPVLNCDPSGIYPVMSRSTKARYRRSVSIQAKKTRHKRKEIRRECAEKSKRAERAYREIHNSCKMPMPQGNALSHYGGSFSCILRRFNRNTDEKHQPAVYRLFSALADFQTAYHKRIIEGNQSEISLLA